MFRGPLKKFGLIRRAKVWKNVSGQSSVVSWKGYSPPRIWQLTRST